MVLRCISLTISDIEHLFIVTTMFLSLKVLIGTSQVMNKIAPAAFNNRYFVREGNSTPEKYFIDDSFV